MEDKPGGTPNPLNPELKSFSNPIESPDRANDFLDPIETRGKSDVFSSPIEARDKSDVFSNPDESSDSHLMMDEPKENFDIDKENRRGGLNSDDFEPDSHETEAERPKSVVPPARPNRTMRRGSMDMVKPSRPNTAPSAYRPIDSMHPINPLQPTSDYEQPTQPLGVVTNLDGSAVNTPSPQQNGDPLSRPMQSAIDPNQAQTPKKKIKPGFVIGMICCIFLAIGCAVAAILFFANTNREDAVSTAIDKLLSTEAPENIKTEGSIDISYNDPSSLIESMKIRINSEMATKYLINSSQALLNAQLRNGKSFSVDLEEIYAANGDLYIKIGGLTDALSNINQATNPGPEETASPETEATAENTESLQAEPDGEELAEEECQGEECPVLEEQNDTLLALEAIFDAFDTADGEWLRIPLDSLDLKNSDDTETNNTLACAANMINDIHETEFSEFYQKNPFITSTTEELHASSELNPIYKVLISSQDFNNFVNDARKSQFVNDLAACWGYEKTNFTADQLLSSLRTLPEMYVEVDENHNFTRFYYVTELTEENAMMTVDLDFTYPGNVNVPEPTEYKDIDEVIQNLSQSPYMTEETK